MFSKKQYCLTDEKIQYDRQKEHSWPEGKRLKKTFS